MSRDLHIIRWLTLILILGFTVAGLQAQELNRADLAKEADQNYGPEIDLVRGQKYFYPYNQASGDPFFNVEENRESVIWVAGKVYKRQQIRYDIYNQLLILEYTGNNRTRTSIVLDNERIEGFRLDDRVFRKYELEDGSKQFGHLVYEGGISCVFFWHKDLEYEVINGEKQNIFSKQYCDMYLLRDGEFHPFRNKRSFLKSLPEEERLKTKTMLKQNRVRIRRVSVRRMYLIMETLEKERNEAG